MCYHSTYKRKVSFSGDDLIVLCWVHYTEVQVADISFEILEIVKGCVFTPVLHKFCKTTGECIGKKIRSHDQRRKETGQGGISQFKASFYIRRDFIIRINCKNS
ncbi:hypothetical protein V1478_007025 [Vespula squamosa]|uniref:Uncharacterized protein n=1 Tax=Vespula squamosa TaxID=30214 RepID=A0ABD2B1Z2_VESSQ